MRIKITPLRAYVALLGACLAVLVAMNAGVYFSRRMYRDDSGRFRLTEVTPDGAQVRGPGGARFALTASPPVWRNEGSGANMVMLRAIANRRVYTLTHPDGVATRISHWVGSDTMELEYTFTDGTSWTTPPVSSAEYPVVPDAGLSLAHPQHIQERDFIDWIIERYWANPRFTGYFHNIFLGLIFLPLGLAALCFPDTFRRWGTNFARDDYHEPPPSRNKLIRLVGVLAAVAVFVFNAILLW